HYTPKGKHLTIDNRRLIERWKLENKSNREIAGLLGKAPQTIHNEIKRGTTLQQVRKGVYKKVYSADYAQTVYHSNRKRSVKKIILTKEMKEKILHYHKQKFSPEMMVKKKQVKVGISTIYYWFHNGHLGLTKADMLYPRKWKGVKKQASPNFKPAGKSIEERPEVINLRLENGHYEIDTVLLTKVKNYCLLVLTDRRSRHQIIRLIPNKTAESVNQALTLLLGEHRILSITADNGSEFCRLAEAFPEEHIYYAHEEVAFIENWINNYPKKCLDYKSPSEFLLGG
ncbi:TPA: IS30 family transposase, partial [Streptococcus suis]